MLILQIDELKLKAYISPLSEAERATNKDSDGCLAKLWHDEDTKWTQHSKVKHIQVGG
jgi:hypothetical protein